MENSQMLKKKDSWFDNKKLIELIKLGLETQNEVRNGDIILMAGPTGSGKSTTINYLTGSEMFKKCILAERYFEGRGYEEYEDEVIDSNGEFQIGHSKDSHTSTLQIIKVQNQYFLCDSPGFFDNRGAEMEIANATTLSNFLKNCNSVRLVILISYPELVAQRGALFKEIFRLVTRILKKPDKESFSKILFLFTKIPENKKIQSIRKEIQDTYLSVQDDEDFENKVMINFLSVILDQLKETNPIVNPLDGNHRTLLSTIIKQSTFTNPSDDFCFSVSEKSNQKIQLYVEETSNSINNLIAKGQYNEVMQILYEFKLLRDYTSIEYLDESYNLMKLTLINSTKKRIENALTVFSEAALKSNIFSLQNIEEIVTIQSYLRIFDQYKGEIFDSNELCEDLFLKEIESIYLIIYKQIAEDFPTNIENVKNNLLKLKEFSEKTALGTCKYKECLTEMNQKYSKEVKQFQELVDLFYSTEDSLDRSQLKNTLNEFAQRLEVFKQIDDFLKQFLVHNSFYTCILEVFKNQNGKLVENIKISISQIHMHIKRSAEIDDVQILNDDNQKLSSFEITLLKIQSDNRKYSEYITDSEQNYREALLYLKEFNGKVLNFIRENSDDDFHLNSLEYILKKLDEIRKLDDSILNQTQEEYNQIKVNLRKKLKQKANEAKQVLELYQDEIQENAQGLVYDKGNDNQFRKQKKDFTQLLKIHEFLDSMKWTDEYFSTKFTQNAIENIIQQLNNYFELCCSKINQETNNENYEALRFYIQRLINIDTYNCRVLISNHQKLQHDCLEKVKLIILEKLKSINDYIKKLTDTNVICNDWNTLNDGIINLKKILQIEYIPELKTQTNSVIQNLTNYMQNYYLLNFEGIKTIAKLGLNFIPYESLEIKYSEFIQQAKLISTDYQELEGLVGKHHSFKQLSLLIEKTYENMVHNYHVKRQENDQDLQDIQNCYLRIEWFVNNMSEIDFLSDRFKQVKTPKESISETFKNLSSLLKNDDFQSLKQQLDLLKNLTGEKDKKKLEKEFNNLKERFESEIYSFSDIINKITEKSIDKEIQESIKQHLTNITGIGNILLEYKKELFLSSSQQLLSKLLNDINTDFIIKQQLQIILLIKNLQFKQMQQNYEQLVIFYKNVDRFKFIFNEEEWNTKIKSVINNLINEIQQTILNLHTLKEMRDLNSLFELMNALTEAQKHHSEFLQYYEKEKNNTISAIQEVFADQKNSIQVKFQTHQNFDTQRLNSEIKALKNFIHKTADLDIPQFLDFQSEINTIDELVYENSKKRQNDIFNLIGNKQFKEAYRTIKSIKQVDEQSYNRIVNKMKDTISFSLIQIKQQYPSLEPQVFRDFFKKAFSHLELRNIFQHEVQEQFEKQQSELINLIYDKSEKLFNECEAILNDNSQIAFTKENIQQLFKHLSFFQTLEEELEKTQKFEQLKTKLNNILIIISNELINLKEYQKQIQEHQIILNTNNKSKKFEALFQISKSETNLFNGFEILKAIKERCSQLLTNEEMINKIQCKFDKSSQDLKDALEDLDFLQVGVCIKNLEKCKSMNQEFRKQFVDFNLLLKSVEKKIITMTEEATLIINRSIIYDQKMNTLINQIYKAEQQLEFIKDISLPSQMDIVFHQLNCKLDEEIQKISQICTKDTDDLQIVSSLIINIQKIQENVNKFTPIVEKKLVEAVQKIKKIHGEDVVFTLGNILKEDSSGAQVVNKIQSFQLYRIDKFNQLVGKHDIHYILKNFELSEKRGKKDKISQTLQDELKQLYEIYDSKYINTLEQYKFQKDLWSEIIDSVKLISKSISLPNKSWEDSSKKNVLNMIALVCAYWTLTESGEQKGATKIIFKRPNHTQIISVIMLLGIHEKDGFILGLKKIFSNQEIKFKNKLIEILTGEGKSLTLGFSSLTLALLGCEVDVICYSQYLSERDNKDFRKLFQSFGVSDKISYGTFKEQAEKYILNHLNVRQSVLNIMNNKSDDSLSSKSSSESLRILLIDEVDIFFNQEYFGGTYNPCTDLSSPEIENIIRDIWSKRDQSQSSIYASVILSSNYNSLLTRFSQFKEYINKQINDLCKSVKNVKQHYQEFNYVIKNNMIGYKDSDSSINFTTSYSYDTLFAYFYQNSLNCIDDQTLKSKISFSLNCGRISYALLPETYTAILGVTGTLSSLNSSMKKSLDKYDIKQEIYSPSMFGTSKLDFKEVDYTCVEKDMENQYIKINEISQTAAKNKQAVLIFFRDKKSLNSYHQSNYLAIPQEMYIRITEHQESDEVDSLIMRSTRSGQISLFVKEYGRGTDFISLDPKVVDAGGVVVIQTFMSQSKTEEIQIKGRTARQGQPGKYYLILNQKDIERDLKLSTNQINSWRNNQYKQTLYQNLAIQRDNKENREYLQIETSIQDAKFMHDETLHFYNQIKSKNTVGTIRYINQYS